MSLNSIRAPDASKDFTLCLDWADWTSLGIVAGRKAVTLDIVTVNRCIFRCGYYSGQGTSKEMMDVIFMRFPRLKFIRFCETSPNICSVMISSFLDTYQVQYVATNIRPG